MEAHSLQSTFEAAKYHSLRVFYKIQEWNGEADTLDPDRSGWKIQAGKMAPIKTDIPPAPPELLQIIRCNCKNNCITDKCTCKKQILECTSVCGHFRGVSYENSQQPDPREDTEDQE